MRSTRPFLPAALLLLALAASPALAHDFWIEASDFHPGANETVSFRLRVGQNFRGDPVPRSDARIERFQLSGPSGEAALAGRDGADPAGTVTLGGAGVYVVGYRSRRTAIELEAKKFEAYLAEEGLDAVLAVRAKRGEREQSGREVYSRCAKAVVLAGTPAAADRRGFDKALGLTLELVPDTDPTALVVGQSFPVRLLYEGKPLAGALVMAMPRDDPGAKQSVRSDSAGKASVKVSRAGVWMVKVVHMVAAPAETNADWESFWASLTFLVPEVAAKE